MISRSDNTAANKVIKILGLEYIRAVCKRLGLTSVTFTRYILDLRARSRGFENYISCRDTAYLLEKIYAKELINEQYCEMMLSFLKQQRIGDRIPKYLPKGVSVAHKTGIERNVVADAGIIFSSEADYILCVFVSDFPTYKRAKEFIAKLSLVVYNTYNTTGE